MKKISIVIPVYNEEKVLEELYRRLVKVMDSLNYEFEVIMVDDGSKDNSLRILEDFCQRDKRFKLISFSRNFGHQTAVSAGIDFTSGDAVIVMDADLQDPPEVLPNFIAKWEEGYDVVYAIRTKRKEGFLKRMAYAAFYRILRYISDIEIPLDSGDFSIMDKKIVDLLKKMPERNRFVRGIRSWLGFRQIGLAYERDPRFAGETKYTFKKLLKLAFDGIVSFSKVPLQFASLMGFIVSAFAIIYGIGTFFQKILTDTTVPGYTTTIIMITFIGGIQLITIGIIGEYIARIYDEVKQRPHYIIKELKGFDVKQDIVVKQ